MRTLGFDHDKVLSIYKRYLESDKADLIVILAEEDSRVFGFIVGLCEAPLFTNDKVCMELAWWVDEDKRNSRDSIQLMKAYEHWAVNIAKAKMVQMAMLNEVTDLDRFYRRLGYRPGETSYIKDF